MFYISETNTFALFCLTGLLVEKENALFEHFPIFRVK
jgi:hypothetical protein